MTDNRLAEHRASNNYRDKLPVQLTLASAHLATQNHFIFERRDIARASQWLRCFQVSSFICRGSTPMLRSGQVYVAPRRNLRLGRIFWTEGENQRQAETEQQPA